MTKQEEIEKLRNRLLALGQPIIIPWREQPQPKGASDPLPSDITIVPYFTEGSNGKGSCINCGINRGKLV